MNICKFQQPLEVKMYCYIKDYKITKYLCSIRIRNNNDNKRCWYGITVTYVSLICTRFVLVTEYG